VRTLADHAAGNHRVLMTLGSDLLAAAVQRDLSQLDEKLYFEVFALSTAAPPERQTAAPARRPRS
jgi:hypothetical protein